MLGSVLCGTFLTAECTSIRLYLAFTSANIIVATPGHLQEMLHQRRCHLAQSLRSLDVLILDEADRLLDMGFRER